MKSPFLNGWLEEEIYFAHLEHFEFQGSEEHMEATIIGCSRDCFQKFQREVLNIDLSWKINEFGRNIESTLKNE